ncbi:MAG: NAD(P)/FAD-dependent oxidoreductase [bacterium]|jgi:uncharacterized FAD-dependent dehydrogenase|nr:NAD(P)/FAD-dependent oxidoreductase [bacterium]MDD3805294.1 NAD(P)/FAD-dependent oxidoreductase [bacterium]MDD4558455.1 NAD(P)/FAD-dependent oxidoreductase [bacterium]
MQYDVIIVGAGPAGIFAALEMVKQDGLKILLIDKGLDIDARKCPGRWPSKACVACDPCSLLCGWGGAGAFSDGKLTLSPDVGGQLDRYISEETLIGLIDYVDRLYLEYGAPATTYGTNDDDIARIARLAVKAELKLVSARIRHMGSDGGGRVLKGIREYLDNKISLAMETTVEHLLVENGRIVGVSTSDGEYRGRYVVAAPGREGSSWLASEAARLRLITINNPVDVGVRVELPSEIMRHITDIVYEPKLLYYSKRFDDRIRTFCVCPNGEVVTEHNNGVITVNGHSYADQKSDKTNFALLVSTPFTEPFHEPIDYGRYMARLANMLGGTVIVQRLGDLLNGRRSTPERIASSIIKPSLSSASPGDLSFVLPYRYLTDIIEMLQALDVLAPGVYSRHTLLYGAEVKFYSSKLKVTDKLETEVSGLYAIGDGAGLTRGLIQASVSGVLAARDILRQEGKRISV